MAQQAPKGITGATSGDGAPPTVIVGFECITDRKVRVSPFSSIRRSGKVLKSLTGVASCAGHQQVGCSASLLCARSVFVFIHYLQMPCMLDRSLRLAFVLGLASLLGLFITKLRANHELIVHQRRLSVVNVVVASFCLGACFTAWACLTHRLVALRRAKATWCAAGQHCRAVLLATAVIQGSIPAAAAHTGRFAGGAA
jgi:hypothetical protein